ncbi:MAG: hypothetical protein ACRD38_00810 [Nitrososphaerales archaeon]
MQRSREKKGISTIIAAVFMIAVIIIGLSAITSGLSFQNNLGQVVTQRNTEETEQGTERIELRDVGIDSNKFNMTVVNTGPLPTKLVRMWVTNTTATTGWHKNYTLSDVINPGDSLPRLGQALSLTAKPDASYDLNVVTERGSTASFKLMSPKDTALKMSISVLPRSSPPQGNVTILFGVSNNLTDGSMVHSIFPVITPSVTDVAGSTVPTWTLIEGPTPITEKNLIGAETVFFKYVYKVNGDPRDKINFSLTVQNAKLGNSISESVEISNVATGQTVTSVITANAGLLTMNFTTFQFCKPSAQNCVSTSADWKAGWKVNSGAAEKYIWRVNITNNGVKDIFLDENTSILALHVQTGGGGGAPTAIYIQPDSTPSVEDGGQYSTNYSKNLEAGKMVTLYFGQNKPGTTSTGLQSIATAGLYAVNMVLFGYQDNLSAGTLHSYDAQDTEPYSQNLPFQGVCATDCN